MLRSRILLDIERDQWVRWISLAAMLDNWAIRNMHVSWILSVVQLRNALRRTPSGIFYHPVAYFHPLGPFFRITISLHSPFVVSMSGFFLGQTPQALNSTLFSRSVLTLALSLSPTFPSFPTFTLKTAERCTVGDVLFTGRGCSIRANHRITTDNPFIASITPTA